MFVKGEYKHNRHIHCFKGFQDRMSMQKTLWSSNFTDHFLWNFYGPTDRNNNRTFKSNLLEANKLIICKNSQEGLE